MSTAVAIQVAASLPGLHECTLMTMVGRAAAVVFRVYASQQQASSLCNDAHAFLARMARYMPMSMSTHAYACPPI